MGQVYLTLYSKRLIFSNAMQTLFFFESALLTRRIYVSTKTQTRGAARDCALD